MLDQKIHEYRRRIFPVYGVGSNPIDSAEYGGNIRKAQFGGMTQKWGKQVVWLQRRKCFNEK
jgi:hypothetical protein